jgi:hypothetical protein
MEMLTDDQIVELDNSLRSLHARLNECAALEEVSRVWGRPHPSLMDHKCTVVSALVSYNDLAAAFGEPPLASGAESSEETDVAAESDLDPLRRDVAERMEQYEHVIRPGLPHPTLNPHLFGAVPD